MKPTPSPRKTEIVFIHKNLLSFSNTRPKRDLIESIKAKLIPNKLKAIPVYLYAGKFLITDGNHRAQGLIERGEDYIPAVILNKQEFDYIKYSKRTLDLMVYYPKPSKIIKRLNDYTPQQLPHLA